MSTLNYGVSVLQYIHNSSVYSCSVYNRGVHIYHIPRGIAYIHTSICIVGYVTGIEVLVYIYASYIIKASTYTTIKIL